MLHRRVARSQWRFLGAALVLIAAAPAALGSVFDSLPHLKRPAKPLCSQYGPCYGHFQVTYRQWPAQCLINPALPSRPNPYRLPAPAAVPEEPVPETPGGAVSGILFEVVDEPVPLVPVTGQQAPVTQPRR